MCMQTANVVTLLGTSRFHILQRAMTDALLQQHYDRGIISILHQQYALSVQIVLIL